MAENDRIWVADMEPSTRYPLYTRANVGEVFPNVLSALGGTLMGDDVGRAQMEVFREIGFVTPRDLDGIRLGTGVFGGYLYANGSLSRIMGVRTPGMNATTSEQQLGTIEGLPPYRREKGDRNLLATVRITAFLSKILRNPDLTPLDAARADAHSWLASMPDVATATDEQLLAFVAEYPQRLAESMKRLLRFSMVAAGPRVVLDMLLDRSSLPAGTGNRLVSGIDDVDSARLAQEQWVLGRIVAGDQSLTELFDGGLDGIDARIVGTALDEPMRAFLATFGHRGNDEYELAAPTWSMNPAPVFAAVDRLRHVPADRSPARAMERLVAERADAERAVVAGMRRPLRSLALRAAAVSRAGSVGRERAKDILVLENLGARRALHALAARAAERGGPTDPRMAFCITIDELPRYLAHPDEFADVIAERAALQQYLDDREPPPWFEGRIPPPSTWSLKRTAATRAVAPADGTVLTGLAVAGGVASGPARVITDPADPRGLEPGEVLVCAITDPSWTPLFLVAAAVVCDTGAQQSHASIVARELGIPAVMNVPEITTIADGTWLEVDGNTGAVRIGVTPSADGP